MFELKQCISYPKTGFNRIIKGNFKQNSLSYNHAYSYILDPTQLLLCWSHIQ